LTFRSCPQILPFMLKHLLLSLALLSSAYAEEKKPNILYIMSDDHAAHAVGVYESRFSKLNPTPNIDRIGNEGIRFDKCFVTNSICTPSRAAIMTGQYANKNGCFGFNEGLPADRHMLAIEMKKQGYETAVIGKWHLKREPANFDHYAVLKGQGNYFNPTFRIRGPQPWPLNTEQIVKYDEIHSSDAIGKMGIKWLKTRKKKNSNSRHRTITLPMLSAMTGSIMISKCQNPRVSSHAGITVRKAPLATAHP